MEILREVQTYPLLSAAPFSTQHFLSCLAQKEYSRVINIRKNANVLDNIKTPVLKAFLTSATNFVYSPILIRVLYFFPVDSFTFLFDATDLEVEASECRYVRRDCQ